MIAYIKGELAEQNIDSIVVECHDIGYTLLVSDQVQHALPPLGSKIKIYTYMHVREDDISLYGFIDKDEMQIFKLLITVNGIGPKGALGVLSSMSTDELRFAIISEDVKTLSKAQGIGQKTAKKMILELRDKIEQMATEQIENVITPHVSQMNASSQLNVSDTEQALVALGYTSAEAIRAIRAVPDYQNLETELLLKEALKTLLK